MSCNTIQVVGVVLTSPSMSRVPDTPNVVICGKASQQNSNLHLWPDFHNLAVVNT